MIMKIIVVWDKKHIRVCYNIFNRGVVKLLVLIALVIIIIIVVQNNKLNQENIRLKKENKCHIKNDIFFKINNKNNK